MLKTGPDSPKAEISLTYTTFSLHPHSLLIYNNYVRARGDVDKNIPIYTDSVKTAP